MGRIPKGYIPSHKVIGPLVLEKKIVFTIYGHGGHLGHVTQTPRTNFRSPIPLRLHCNLALIGSLKMVSDGWRLTDDRPWLYYKVTYEPKGSGELMIQSFRTDRLSKQRRSSSDCSCSLIRVYTVCHSVCICLTHHPMVKAYGDYSIFWGVQFFLFLWYSHFSANPYMNLYLQQSLIDSLLCNLQYAMQWVHSLMNVIKKMFVFFKNELCSDWFINVFTFLRRFKKQHIL